MALPELTVNPDIRIPRAPGIPAPRVASLDVMTPHVITPQKTEITGLNSIADALRTGAQEGNTVAKLYAKQAGYQAITRDDDGNLVVTRAPIVGEAATAFQDAVKYTALAQGESEAKQKDLVLSKQFENDPQGYLEAAKSFRDAHVQQYAQSFGPEVSTELGKSIDLATSNNYRWLVLDQQRRIKTNFDQATRARIDSLDEDIFSLLGSGDKGSAQLQSLIQERTAVTQSRSRNPILGEAPEVGALDLKQFDLKAGAAQFSSGVRTIMNNPAGGISVAQKVVDDELHNEKISPTQRVLNNAEGNKAIKEYQQNLERQVGLNAKAQKLRDDQFEDTVIKDSASPNPTIDENQIKTVPGISPESRMRMLAWQKRDGLPEPISRVSQSTAMDLFRRMSLDEGDAGKVNSLTPIRNAYVNGQLKREDEEWLEKRFNEARTPDGSRLDQIRSQFSKAVEPTIDKSNPLLGKIDQDGKLQVYAFQRFVDAKVDEYRKGGKSPYDLFDPSKPDYLGKPETLQNFKIPLEQSIRNIGRNLGAATPGGRTTPAREPGESPADWLKRVQQPPPGQ